MKHTPSIALVHASIGSGHKVAAQAIEEAFALHYPDATTHLIDVLDYSARHIDGDTLTRSFAGPTGPIYDAVWDNYVVGRIVWGSTGWITRKFYTKFTDHLRDVDPDIVICTHALGANIAIGSRIALSKPASLKRDFLTIGVPTDYGVNASWPQAYLDMFCIGDEDIRDVLLARHIPASRIAITGIPTHKAFGSYTDKEAVRGSLGFSTDKDHRIVLALAGASMPGPYIKFKQYLNRALPELCSHENTTIAIVTGKDSEYADELRELSKQPGFQNLRVFGFVDDMAALMGASDLLICKPGGLTCTEGIRSGLPLLLVGHAMGQERVNVESLGPRNISRHAFCETDMVQEFTEILTTPGQLESMQRAACNFRKPDSAEAIAHQAMTLLQKKEDLA